MVVTVSVDDTRVLIGNWENAMDPLADPSGNTDEYPGSRLAMVERVVTDVPLIYTNSVMFPKGTKSDCDPMLRIPCKTSGEEDVV